MKNLAGRIPLPTEIAAYASEIYFDAVLAAYRSAASQVGVRRYFVKIAGAVIALYFAGEALIGKIIPALAHLLTAEDEHPALTVCLWDSASTDTALPAKPWSHDFDDSGGFGEVRGFNTERIATIEQQKRYHGVDALHLYDAQRRLAIFCCPDAARIPYWMESFPLRVLFHCWTLRQPHQLVHGGAVGLPQGGVLLVGRGGSGKSTSTLACLNSDLMYAGDDYVMASLEPEPTIFSLYNAAKIEGNTLFRVPHIEGMVTNAARLGEEKALIFLHEHCGDKLITRFPLKAIIQPRITGERDTRLAPATPMQVLAEIAPTTLFQLRSAPQVAFAKLSALVRSVPSYTLELGTDVTQIPDVLMALLR